MITVHLGDFMPPPPPLATPESDRYNALIMAMVLHADVSSAVLIQADRMAEAWWNAPAEDGKTVATRPWKDCPESWKPHYRYRMLYAILTSNDKTIA